MMRTAMLRLLPLIMVAIGGLSTLSALAQSRVTEREPSTATAQMQEEVGRMALEYWTPKLNAYKMRIDRTLNQTDLDRLNRLRVRWAVLTSELMTRKNNVRQYVDGNEAKMEFQIGAEEDQQKVMEIVQIYMQAQQIARQYRPELAELGNTALEDFQTFSGRFQQASRDFVEKRASGLERSEAAELMDEQQALDSVLARLRSEKGRQELRAIYDFAFQPIILLYNGADLRDVMGQVSSIGNGSVSGGLEIPAGSALAQNFPNPASSTTTVTYRLTDESSRTTLRIYDASGAVVKTINEGARPAGEHSVLIDVSELAVGSYLYHLTVKTGTGDQVHSRVMTVVR